MGGISSGGVPGRIMPAIALVLLTFNFSSHSFYQPISAPRPGITAEKAFAAAALRIGWIVCVRTAFVALGVIGAVLCAAVSASSSGSPSSSSASCPATASRGRWSAHGRASPIEPASLALTNAPTAKP